MRKLLASFSLLLAGAASAAVGPLINGNQINPQTAISIATFTTTGAGVVNINGAAGLNVVGPVTAASGTFTATGATQFSVVTSSGINVSLGGVYAAFMKATTGFFGNLIGNVTGNLTGNVTGNADTATALAATPTAASSGYVCRGISVLGACLPALVDATTAGVSGSTSPWSSGAAFIALPLKAALTGATFTGAVGLTNVALTLTGSGGFITSGSSITASSFFGNGANLTGIPGSSVTRSSFSFTASQSITAASASYCLPLSTRSITSNGTWTDLSFFGPIYNGGATSNNFFQFYRDGSPGTGGGIALGTPLEIDTTVSTFDSQVALVTSTKTTSGAHTYCLAAWTSGNTLTFCANLASCQMMVVDQ